jgi:DNA modification methylase
VAGAVVRTGELRGEVVDPASLELFPGNPRRGDVGAIVESLKAHGQYRPLVANQRTRRVLGGNHTLLAIRELGLSRVAVSWVDVPESAEGRIVAIDNRSSDLASYDVEELVELLSGLDGLEGTGYDESDLAGLLDELDPGPLLEEAPPALPREPLTRPGELVRLGEHRLVCGDARDRRVYERLLGGEPAGMMWTDPPYGVSYEGKTLQRLRIANDRSCGLAELLASALARVDAVLTAGAAVYMAHPAGPLQGLFISAFCGVGWQLRQSLIWVKDSFVLGRSDYHFRHEPILFGYKPAEQGRRGRGGVGWFGDNRQSSVFEIDRPRSSEEHPTMKPVELIEPMVRNSSRRGEVVLDPFAGSGSTLVACQRLGRRARLVEIDPAYCDVIIMRFERQTGQPAVREGF